jgi:acyl dehydratase
VLAKSRRVKAKKEMIQWFDDLTLGMRFKSGEVSVSKEDIKRFAAEFDPQPFHLDEAAAEKRVLARKGRVAASRENESAGLAVGSAHVVQGTPQSACTSRA